jgi:DnaJ-class molecular chaperone
MSPEVAERLVDDDTCPDCDGMGEIGGGFDDPDPCHRCLGTGVLAPLCCPYCRASEPALCLCP